MTILRMNVEIHDLPRKFIKINARNLVAQPLALAQKVHRNNCYNNLQAFYAFWLELGLSLGLLICT